jgi:hypothetical protein
VRKRYRRRRSEEHVTPVGTENSLTDPLFSTPLLQWALRECHPAMPSRFKLLTQYIPCE